MLCATLYTNRSSRYLTRPSDLWTINDLFAHNCIWYAIDTKQRASSKTLAALILLFCPALLLRLVLMLAIWPMKTWKDDEWLQNLQWLYTIAMLIDCNVLDDSQARPHQNFFTLFYTLFNRFHLPLKSQIRLQSHQNVSRLLPFSCKLLEQAKSRRLVSRLVHYTTSYCSTEALHDFALEPDSPLSRDYREACRERVTPIHHLVAWRCD